MSVRREELLVGLLAGVRVVDAREVVASTAPFELDCAVAGVLGDRLDLVRREVEAITFGAGVLRAFGWLGSS